MTFGDAGSSDDDVEVEVKKKKAGTPGKTKRSKECPGCGAVLSLSVRECGLCDYQFTSKSMLMTQQTAAQESTQIREKFPFEPERVSSLQLIDCLTDLLCPGRRRQSVHREDHGPQTAQDRQ